MLDAMQDAMPQAMRDASEPAMRGRRGDAIHERTNGRTDVDPTHQPAHLQLRNAHAHIPGFDVVEVKR